MTKKRNNTIIALTNNHSHMNSLRIIASAVILFSVAACRLDKEYVIGVSQCSEDLWRDEINKELRMEAMLRQDITLVIKSVKDDSGQQIEDIKELVAEGVDLLVVSPNESSALTPVISEVYRSGIPVILFALKDPENILRVVMGEKIGTIVKEEP